MKEANELLKTTSETQLSLANLIGGLDLITPPSDEDIHVIKEPDTLQLVDEFIKVGGFVSLHHKIDNIDHTLCIIYPASLFF